MKSTAAASSNSQAKAAAANAARLTFEAAAMAVVRPKMDASRALALLGFSSSRSLDPINGNDPKAVLNAALIRRMEDVEKRKRGQVHVPVEDRPKDDVRILHEAYQFLAKKYASKRGLAANDDDDDDKNIVSPLMMLDQQSHHFRSFLSSPDHNEDENEQGHLDESNESQPDEEEEEQEEAQLGDEIQEQ